mmetsp:Transcript_18830/g.46177  ORF Transcript_18830/g.46177 Transcript_18830/m.46177 type:complete len:279 (-) Transcript_18830:174-1010(-)
MREVPPGHRARHHEEIRGRDDGAEERAHLDALQRNQLDQGPRRLGPHQHRGEDGEQEDRRDRERRGGVGGREGGQVRHRSGRGQQGERRGPDHRRGEGDAREDGVYGELHQRDHMRWDYQRAVRGIGAPTDGGPEHGVARHRLHSFDRLQARHQHRDLRRGPNEDDPRDGGRGGETGGLRPPRAHLPPSRQERRRVGEARAHRDVRRPPQTGRTEARGCHERDREPGRIDVQDGRAEGFRGEVQPEDDYNRGDYRVQAGEELVKCHLQPVTHRNILTD